MTSAEWLDLTSYALVLLGAVLSLSAGLGLMRFPDMIYRLHAQAKPQSAGLLFILVGLALQQTDWSTILFLVPVLVFQFLTTPAAGMVLARGGYRSKHFEGADLYVDELRAEVDRAQRAEEAAEAREQARTGRARQRTEVDTDIEPGAPGSLSI